MATHSVPVASNGTPPPKPKELLLNAFVMNTPGHLSPGMWNHPRNQTADYNKLSFWTGLASYLDKHGFHTMFIADTLGAYEYKGPHNVNPILASGAQFPVNDPLFLVPAMAAVTKNLVFGVTASTTYDSPYGHARRFSTVDHFSEGRIAWNIVEHDERYRKADEFMDVVCKLWKSSWADGVAIRVKENGVFAEEGRVLDINHEGKNFTVPGPHICEPSPQRTPFMFQAGTSKAGIAFGSKHAEAIFAGAQTPEKLKPSIDALREGAKAAGRDPNHIKIFAGMTIIVDETNEKAQAKKEEFLKYGNGEGALALFGGWTGVNLPKWSDDEDFRFVDELPAIVNRWAATVPGTEGLKWTKNRIVDYLLVGGMTTSIVGGPKTVVDELQRWADTKGIHGFNLSHIVNPGSFEDIVEFVLPELRRRDLFRKEIVKEGATAREVFFGQSHVLEDHPAYQFKFK